jgi:hypothetical protein
MAGLASGIRRFIARMGGTVLIAVAAVSSSGMGRPAMAEDIKAFPLAIICEFSGISHVFYLSKLESDGVATYLRPDGVIGRVSLTGTASVVGGEGERGTCGGKTIDELRSAGQTFEFDGE